MLTNEWRGLKPGISTVSDAASAIGPPDRIAKAVTYGSVADLRLATYDDLKASLFFRADKLFLIVLVPGGVRSFPVTTEEWESAMGKPNVRLPSIRGKNSRIYVYSEKGLTATADGDRVRLVEVFAPMTPDEYRQTVYKVPPVFAK